MDAEKPSTSTNVPLRLDSSPKLKTTTMKTGPLSLEVFNHAATDLAEKEEINLKNYSKYLYRKSKPIYKMDYPVDEKMPETDFVKLLSEKANMLKKHLKDTQSSLVVCANIGPNVAIFKLYNTLEEDSVKLCCTISNLSDLEEHLYQL